MASFNTKPTLRNPLLSSASLASKKADSKLPQTTSIASSLLTHSSLRLSNLGVSLDSGSSQQKGSLHSSSRPSLRGSSTDTSKYTSSLSKDSKGSSTSLSGSLSSKYLSSSSRPSSYQTSNTAGLAKLHPSSLQKEDPSRPQKLISEEEEGVIPFLGCFTEDLPLYTLAQEQIAHEQVTALGFPDPKIDLSLSLTGGIHKASHDVTNAKRQLLHGMAAALIGGPNYKDPKNHGRLVLMYIASRVAFYDPEFVLKSVLYSRQELNLRTPSNFLLAFASMLHSCRPYLKRYYSASIRLPSDWIEVAELYQTLCDSGIKFKSLPVALRKVMVVKFQNFDNYQLAKYNKDKAKNRKKREKKKGKQEQRTDRAKVGESSAIPESEYVLYGHVVSH